MGDVPLGTSFLFGMTAIALIKAVVQVSVLVAIGWWVYQRFIRHSYAEHLVRGLLLILLVFSLFWVIARVFNLPLWEAVFGLSVELLMFGVIVVFQPEIRRIFVYVGQVDRMGRSLQSVAATGNASIIQELLETVRFLRKTRQGALVVIEPSGSSGVGYLESGTRLDALLSAELLLTIFHPKTPLHDGAVVISGNRRLTAAGVLLPLTEDPKLSWQYGTRHRAAIGLSEVSDYYCLVVSEETGNISLAYQGQLERLMTIDDLKKKLEGIFNE